MPFPLKSDPFYCVGSLTKDYTAVDSRSPHVSRCTHCERLITRMVNGYLHPHLKKCKRTQKWDNLHESLTTPTSVRIIDGVR